MSEQDQDVQTGSKVLTLFPDLKSGPVPDDYPDDPDGVPVVEPPNAEAIMNDATPPNIQNSDLDDSGDRPLSNADDILGQTRETPESPDEFSANEDLNLDNQASGESSRADASKFSLDEDPEDWSDNLFDGVQPDAASEAADADADAETKQDKPEPGHRPQSLSGMIGTGLAGLVGLAASPLIAAKKLAAVPRQISKEKLERYRHEQAKVALARVNGCTDTLTGLAARLDATEWGEISRQVINADEKGDKARSDSLKQYAKTTLMQQPEINADLRAMRQQFAQLKISSEDYLERAAATGVSLEDAKKNLGSSLTTWSKDFSSRYGHLLNDQLEKLREAARALAEALRQMFARVMSKFRGASDEPAPTGVNPLLQSDRPCLQHAQARGLTPCSSLRRPANGTP